MNREHPSAETWRQFLLAAEPAGAHEWVKDHLRTGCASCLYAARELMGRLAFEHQEHMSRFLDRRRSEAERREELGPFLEQAFRRSLVVDCERDLAPALVPELELRPPALRREAIRTAPR